MFEKAVSRVDVCLCVNVMCRCVLKPLVLFSSPKQHYRDFVKLDLTYNLKNHLVCDLQA